MSFLNKLKKGASDAGEKAKVVIEVNKLKLQQSQTQKEINEEFKKMGETVFQLFQNGSFDGLAEMVEDRCNNCMKKQKEIRELEQKIEELNNERKCPNCKEIIDSDIKFCPSCGHSFESSEK